MVLGTGFGLARMKNEGFGVKGSKLGSVTSSHYVTSRHCKLLSRVVTSSRVVTVTCCHESSLRHESSPWCFFKEV